MDLLAKPVEYKMQVYKTCPGCEGTGKTQREGIEKLQSEQEQKECPTCKGRGGWHYWLPLDQIKELLK